MLPFNRMAFPKDLKNDLKCHITKEEESFSYAMQLVMSSVLSMSLQSATELGIFNIIAKAGTEAKLSSSEIAAQLPSTNPKAPSMLDRILKLLASHSVLNCSVVEDEDGHVQTLYGLAPVSKHFVTNEEGVSLGPFLALIQDKVFLGSWPQLKEAVIEGGIPFNRVYETHLFEHPRLDLRFNKVFNTAMYNLTTIAVKRMLGSYTGFEKVRQLVDVGGGVGVTLNLITSKYPHIKGLNFDLPHVLRDAPSYPGVEHVGGYMFASVPSGDAIFMKSILHDWSDEHCIKLLKNCFKAIPKNGKVIVMEAVLPAVPESTSAFRSNAYEFDVLMMTQCPGGKERNQQEFMALATAAGFSGIKFECFVCNFLVVEFLK